MSLALLRIMNVCATDKFTLHAKANTCTYIHINEYILSMVCLHISAFTMQSLSVCYYYIIIIIMIMIMIMIMIVVIVISIIIIITLPASKLSLHCL